MHASVAAPFGEVKNCVSVQEIHLKESYIYCYFRCIHPYSINTETLHYDHLYTDLKRAQDIRDDVRNISTINTVMCLHI
jgi:hypothetical protein